MEISGYTLGRVIEKKGCCTTFNALDIEQSKTVLLKLFSPEITAVPGFVDHFRQVTDQLKGRRLGHNIPIRDAFFDQGSCAFVTNYYPHISPRHGEGLTYSEEEVIKFGMQLAEALNQLHVLGLVHGGVDLTNIHILKTGDVVLDVVELQRTLPGNSLLSPDLQSLQDRNYLAPEADAGLTPATDFYSLGVLLYELLTGSKPFAAASAEALVDLKRDAQYTPLDPPHAHLKPLFDSLLAGEPIPRIDSLDDFMFVLSRCWDEDDLQAASSEILSDPEPLPPAKTAGTETGDDGRKPGLILPALGVAAVLILVAAYFLLRDPKQTEVVSNRPPQTTNVTGGQEASTPADASLQKTPQQTPETTTVYQQALGHYQAGEYEAALGLLSSQQLAAGDVERATILKHEIQLRLEIDRLRLLAQQQMEAEKFVSPQGDNALESYRQLAKLTTDADKQVIRGIRQLTEHFQTLAAKLLQEQNWDASRQAIADGLRAAPDYAPLLTLKAKLDEAVQQAAKAVDFPPAVETDVADQQITPAVVMPTNSLPLSRSADSAAAEPAKASSRVGPEARQQAKRQREQEQALEAQRQAEERARLAKARRLEQENRERQLREERRLARQRERVLLEAEIDRLVSVTETSLQVSPATLSSLGDASDGYRSLQALAENEPRLQPLLDNITFAHLTLARTQLQAKEYAASASTIQQGLTLDPNNRELLALREAVAQARVQQQTKPKPKVIPVIGTF